MSDQGLTDPPDWELVTRAQNGDREAFGELYTRYLSPIYRYLRSRLSDPRDAEDLTESAFLKAYQALPRYRERGWPFSAYLYQVARNALADHFRRRRPEVDLDGALAAPATDPGPAEYVEHGEMMVDLAAGVRSLPEDYQEVIRLRLLLGLPTTTAAQWMRRSEGATRVLLFRALRALRKKMKEQYDGERQPGSG